MAILLILYYVVRGDFYVFFIFIFCRTALKTYFLHCSDVYTFKQRRNNAENTCTFSLPCGEKKKTRKDFF